MGNQIDPPSGRELADLTDTLNLLSSKLRQEMDYLESRVKERTESLDIANAELSEAVKRREETISELKNALGEIKTLRGILPICSHCKNVRDDKGYWRRIEAYIEAHSEADLSHGICPKCAEKYYPGVRLSKE